MGAEEYTRLLEGLHRDLFWLPPDVRIVQRPEIVYTICARDVSHLNCVYALDAPDEAIPALVEEVLAAHPGVRTKWMVHESHMATALEAILAAAGFTLEHEHLGFAIPTSCAKFPDTPGIEVRRVSSRDELLVYHTLLDRVFGGEGARPEVEIEKDLQNAVGHGARVRFFLAFDCATGAPMAQGGLSRDPGIALLFGGGTVPEHRRRGAYSAVVAARVAAARELGLELAGLYARLGQSAPIVEKLGFTRAGRMSYWVHTPGAGTGATPALETGGDDS